MEQRIISQGDEKVKNERHIRNKFTNEEDSKLRALVEQYGTKSWKIISECMGGRSQRQCRERYHNYLSPYIKNYPWTKFEDDLLIQKVKEMGKKWAKIAPYFKSRSDVNIKNRYALLTSKRNVEKYESHNKDAKKVSKKAKINDSIRYDIDEPKFENKKDNEIQKTLNNSSEENPNENKKTMDEDDVLTKAIDKMINEESNGFLSENELYLIEFDFNSNSVFNASIDFNAGKSFTFN